MQLSTLATGVLFAIIACSLLLLVLSVYLAQAAATAEVVAHESFMQQRQTPPQKQQPPRLSSSFAVSRDNEEPFTNAVLPQQPPPAASKLVTPAALDAALQKNNLLYSNASSGSSDFLSGGSSVRNLEQPLPDNFFVSTVGEQERFAITEAVTSYACGAETRVCTVSWDVRGSCGPRNTAVQHEQLRLVADCTYMVEIMHADTTKIQRMSTAADAATCVEHETIPARQRLFPELRFEFRTGASGPYAELVPARIDFFRTHAADTGAAAEAPLLVRATFTVPTDAKRVRWRFRTPFADEDAQCVSAEPNDSAVPVALYTWSKMYVRMEIPVFPEFALTRSLVAFVLADTRFVKEQSSHSSTETSRARVKQWRDLSDNQNHFMIAMAGTPENANDKRSRLFNLRAGPGAMSGPSSQALGLLAIGRPAGFAVTVLAGGARTPGMTKTTIPQVVLFHLRGNKTASQDCHMAHTNLLSMYMAPDGVYVAQGADQQKKSFVQTDTSVNMPYTIVCGEEYELMVYVAGALRLSVPRWFDPEYRPTDAAWEWSGPRRIGAICVHARELCSAEVESMHALLTAAASGMITSLRAIEAIQERPTRVCAPSSLPVSLPPLPPQTQAESNPTNPPPSSSVQNNTSQTQAENNTSQTQAENNTPQMQAENNTPQTQAENNMTNSPQILLMSQLTPEQYSALSIDERRMVLDDRADHLFARGTYTR